MMSIVLSCRGRRRSDGGYSHAEIDIVIKAQRGHPGWAIVFAIRPHEVITQFVGSTGGRSSKAKRDRIEPLDYAAL